MTKPSARSKIVRSPNRAHYDAESLYKVLDDGFLCHVAYDYMDSPVIIPTAYVREEDVIYIHGALKHQEMQLQIIGDDNRHHCKSDSPKFELSWIHLFKGVSDSVMKGEVPLWVRE